MDTPDTYSHLFWGYSAIWAFLVGYVLLMRTGQGRLATQIDRMENELRLLIADTRTPSASSGAGSVPISE